MTDAADDIVVADAPERQRFELTIGGELIGVCDYRIAGQTMTLPHTEVAESHTGHGYAAMLVRAALDTARDRGLRVRPVCPYVADYIAKHPDDRDLVA